MLSLDNIDASDVLLQQGANELKNQIQAVINSPTPQSTDSSNNDDEAPTKTQRPKLVASLDTLLRRYKLIIKDGKSGGLIFDADQNLKISKSNFVKMYSHKLANEFFQNEPAKIGFDEVERLTQPEKFKNVDDMLQNYVYIRTRGLYYSRRQNEVMSKDVMMQDNPLYFHEWQKSPERQEVEAANFFFDPSCKRTASHEGEPYINTFKGLDCEELDLPDEEIKQLCSPVLKGFWHLVNGDIDMYHLVVNWLAIPLQHMGTKMNTALMFHGNIQGAGKSLLFDRVMRCIYGTHAVTLTQSQLDTQFNDWISGKMWGVFEEVFAGSERFANKNKVKQLVTGETLMINKKNMNGWEEQNFVNFVFLSNEPMPVAVESDDRRMIVCKPLHKMPKELSLAISQGIDEHKDIIRRSELQGKTMINAWYTYLLRKDVGNQRYYDEAPINDAKRAVMELSKLSYERFIDMWLAGELDIPVMICAITDLCQYYKRWCEEQGEKRHEQKKMISCLKTKYYTDKNGQKKLITLRRARYNRENHTGKVPPNHYFVMVGEIDEQGDIEKQFTDCYNAWREACNVMQDAYTRKLDTSSMPPSFYQPLTQP